MDLEEANNLKTPTPKLSLFTLRYKPPPELPGGNPTPPLHTAASIPFLWEEIPGKPRTTTTFPAPQPPPTAAKSKAVRSLNLPPRLLIPNTTTNTTPDHHHHHHSSIISGSSNNYDKVLDQIKITNLPSPTTVLVGPFLSPEDKEDDQKKKKKKKKKPLNLITSSWRWEKSFPANARKYSSFRYDDNNGDSTKNNASKVRRRGSFFSLTSSSSNFLANIYGGLKESVSRRRR